MLSCLSRVWLFAISWTVACQAPLSMGFSGQVSWSGLPCLPPGDLPDPGIKPESLTSPGWIFKVIISNSRDLLSYQYLLWPGNTLKYVLWIDNWQRRKKCDLTFEKEPQPKTTLRYYLYLMIWYQTGKR